MNYPKALRLRNIVRAVGFLALITSYFLHGDPEGAKWAISVVAGTMTIWWIFEVAPLGVTALLPLVAYPLLGITNTKNVAPYYMNSTLFIFIGGFFVALAMQRCNLHRRIALAIICFFGNSSSRIILGFMSATWFLSMWISNTATAVMMAFLWIFRRPFEISFLDISIPSWMAILHDRTQEFTDDGTIAVICSLILFFLPSMGTRKKLLVKSDISSIPWETILLFGGGFALAKGMGDSGLSNFLVEQFKNLGDLSLFATIAILTGGMSFLTELTSNTASTQLVLPILVAMSKSLNVDALYLMIPTTLAASCAFMLPAATAPNAIIFSSKKVTIAQMIETGFIINILSILAVSIWCYIII